MTNITSKSEQVVQCQSLADTGNEHHGWDHRLGKKQPCSSSGGTDHVVMTVHSLIWYIQDTTRLTD